MASDFRARAIITTDRDVPSPIWLAAIVGVEKMLRLELDTSSPEAIYARQARAKLPRHAMPFGRVVGFLVNYSPVRAVRFDLKGRPTETLAKAVECGKSCLATVH